MKIYLNFFVCLVSVFSAGVAAADSAADMESENPVAAAIRKEFAGATSPITVTSFNVGTVMECVVAGAEIKKSQLKVNSLYPPVLVEFEIDGDPMMFALKDGQLVASDSTSGDTAVARLNSSGQIIFEIISETAAEADDLASISNPAKRPSGYALCK